MTYLDGPRFVVRELEGFSKYTSNSKQEPGLCVTVHDRAYCGQVLRMWRTEERGGQVPVWMKRAEVRTDAALYAAELNGK